MPNAKGGSFKAWNGLAISSSRNHSGATLLDCWNLERSRGNSTGGEERDPAMEARKLLAVGAAKSAIAARQFFIPERTWTQAR
jgi:hypothetical protein